MLCLPDLKVHGFSGRVIFHCTLYLKLIFLKKNRGFNPWVAPWAGDMAPAKADALGLFVAS